MIGRYTCLLLIFEDFMKIDLDEFNIKNKTIKEEFFTFMGLQEFIDEKGYPKISSDTDISYAKICESKKSKSIIDNKESYRFYIKTDPNNNIINPKKIYSDKNFDLKSNTHLNKICKHTEQYKEVSESIFKKYIEFLKTQNIKWLKEAQRELI